ncbi:MAG: sulfite exporter TauE/SafE family protein [Rhodospirillales bacterium]|nr:sulfite exporter TauE/SafE family protein [Rhodospirillales bacterium]
MSFESFLIVFVAIGLGAFAKGATGIGLPLIGIPIMAGFLGVEHAIVVMTIPVAASNIWLVWSYRKLVTAIPGLPFMLVMGVIGTLLGTYVLATLDDRTLIYMLAIWIGLYLVNLTFNPNFRLEGKTARYASPILATCAGISQGATGMSGPVIATWIHSYNLESKTFVFGVSIMFLAISGTHVLAVSGAGLMSEARLYEGLLALIPTALFLPLGMRMTNLFSTKIFNRIIICLIVIMEIKLIWRDILS